MAQLTIDGKEIEVPDGTSLFAACEQARGTELPHFCYHPDLSVAGVCRLCQVEVEGMPKLTIACNTTVRDGMVVHTKNERVSRATRQILEMHLINHPVDCPICDQAGECGLQDQYMDHGLYDAKVEQPDKVNKAKVKVIGPQVILDKERCVLCSRCVRFCDEVTGTGELGIFNRGDRAEIDVAPGVQLDNNYSLNTVDICPVGALTSRDFRFQKRVWMLKSTDSICPGCATGCNVRVDHEAGRIYRLKPRRNPAVNGPWMCDKGRMVYKQVHDEKRLTAPRWRGEPLAWAEVGARLAELGTDLGLAVASPHQTLEEMFLLRRLAGSANASGGLADADRGDADGLLLNADRTPNRAGLALLNLNQDDGATLAAQLREARGPVLIHGGDPAADAAVAEALAARTDVIYLGTHDNATAQAAALALPGATWAEKTGTIVNKDGRAQRLRQAVARPGQAREDWRVLAELFLDSEGRPASLKAAQGQLTAALGAAHPVWNDLALDRLPSLGLVPGGEG